MTGMLVSLSVLVAVLVAPSLQAGPAPNDRIPENCVGDNMPNMFPTINMTAFGGLWFMTHFSQGADFAIDYSVVGVNREISAVVSKDHDGNAQTFVEMKKIALRCSILSCWCQPGTSLWTVQSNDSDIHSPYYYQSMRELPAADDNDAIAEGKYVSFVEETLLATDYTSTAVVALEPVFDGQRDSRFAEFQVYVRDRQAQPDQAVLDAAFKDTSFCGGDFQDLSSNYWVRFNNGWNILPCFN